MSNTTQGAVSRILFVDSGAAWRWIEKNSDAKALAVFKAAALCFAEAAGIKGHVQVTLLDNYRLVSKKKDEKGEIPRITLGNAHNKPGFQCQFRSGLSEDNVEVYFILDSVNGALIELFESVAQKAAEKAADKLRHIAEAAPCEEISTEVVSEPEVPELVPDVERDESLEEESVMVRRFASPFIREIDKPLPPKPKKKPAPRIPRRLHERPVRVERGGQDIQPPDFTRVTRRNQGPARSNVSVAAKRETVPERRSLRVRSGVNWRIHEEDVVNPERALAVLKLVGEEREGGILSKDEIIESLIKLFPGVFIEEILPAYCGSLLFYLKQRGFAERPIPNQWKLTPEGAAYASEILET